MPKKHQFTLKSVFLKKFSYNIVLYSPVYKAVTNQTLKVKIAAKQMGEK